MIKKSTCFMGFSVAVAVLGSMGCKSREFNTTENAKGKSDNSARPSDTVQKKPILNWLYVNDATFRGYVATNMESQLKDLLESKKPEDAPTRVLALETIKALREGADTLCEESEKITMFRGHGFGLIPQTKDGKKLIFSHAFTEQLGRFDGVNWEDSALKLYPEHHVDVASYFANYSGNQNPDPECDDGKAIGRYDYAKLAERHTAWCKNSPFISFSLNPEVARAFKAPIIEAKVCPGRALPTSLQAFGNEEEWLVLGFLLPEEIVKIHSPETQIEYRKGLKDDAAKQKAEEQTASLDFPQTTEPLLRACSTNRIGLQPAPAYKEYVQEKQNEWTKSLVSILEAKHSGAVSGASLKGWKDKATENCSCEAYAKEKGEAKEDVCNQ